MHMKSIIEYVVKIGIIAILITMMTISIIGCEQTQANRVSYNLSQEADNFKCPIFTLKINYPK